MSDDAAPKKMRRRQKLEEIARFQLHGDDKGKQFYRYLLEKGVLSSAASSASPNHAGHVCQCYRSLNCPCRFKFSVFRSQPERHSLGRSICCEHPDQGEKYQGFTLKQWVLAVCASIWQFQARCLSMLGPRTMWWHRFRRCPMGILPRDRIVYRNLSQRSCREVSVLHINLSCTPGIEMSYGDLANRFCIEMSPGDLAKRSCVQGSHGELVKRSLL